MVFSKNGISRLLENGEISIQPFDESLLKGASYSFTLDKKLSVPKEIELIDTRNPITFDDTEIQPDGHTLNPGDFIVGYTKERIKLNNKYVCLVSSRATLAQMGLNVTQSSFLAEPDTDNTLALEMSNVGKVPIKLFTGMKIVKGLFLGTIE